MKGFFIRIAKAIKEDPSIVVERSDVAEADGCSLEYLESLGIRKADLTKLERNGMVVRGRLPLKHGHKIKWLLLRG